LTPASASNTLSCQRETLHFIRNNSADQKSLDEDHGIYRDLRNPLGSKSAGIAGGICADLGETAQQRGFASELRRCQRAAAARISPHDLHLSAEQIGNRGSAAAIRHVDQLIPVISI
jgi:hypothetical protein